MITRTKFANHFFSKEKMKAKFLLGLLAIAMICLMPVQAQQKQLLIQDVDYDDPFAPGTNAEVVVTLENTATALDTYTNLEDITLKAWLINADDNTRVGDKIEKTLNILHQDDDKDITLFVPIPADARLAQYTLHIEAKGYWSDHTSTIGVTEAGASFWEDFIEVEQQDHSIKLVDVHLNADSVQVGNSLLIAAKVLNNGLNDEPTLKIKAEIPAIDVEKSITILGGLQQDADATTYINLEIPAKADTGLFDLKVTAFTGDVQSVVIKKVSITSAPRIVTDEPASQIVTKASADLKAGKGAALTIKVKNNANVAKTFDLTLGGAADWTSSSRVDPGSASIGAGEQKDVVVYLVPLSTVSGKHTATLYVKETGNLVSSIEIEADIAAAQMAAGTISISKRDLLTWGFLGFVAVLAIIAIVLILLKDNGTGKKAERVYY